MHATVSELTTGGRKLDGKSVCNVTDKCGDKSDADWFAEVCSVLFAHKAGTQLHYATGHDERSCQRYASGQVRPPAYFLRALLRSEQGQVWLAALMDGSGSAWWAELRAARQLCEQFQIRPR